MQNMMTENNQIELDECPFTSGMGTINASGVIKNIRGSKLSVTEVFLREAVQNSYDAREKSEDPRKKKQLIFNMHAYKFSELQFETLKNLLDKSKTSNSFFQKYLKKNISKSMLNIEISDTNTTGLLGSIEPTDKIEGQNFADFVYSTGSKKIDDNTGGTFGFGKAALYAYSQARTIAVYTKIAARNLVNNEKVYQSRFIIITSDERISDTKSDRCWWGVRKPFKDASRGTYAAPALDKDADIIAKSLGMSVFDYDETGTKILIFNAGPDELPKDIYDNKLSMEEVFKENIPKYLVHWYWNKIINKNIDFHLYFENQEILIDNPKDIYPYNKFWESYYKYRINLQLGKTNTTKTFCPVFYERPKVNLGYISLSNTIARKIKYKELFDCFETNTPVIAYMRGIGHIVYYSKVPIDSNNFEETCYGIFKTDKNSAPEGEKRGSIDRYFRDIENQTHDRWEHRKEEFPRNYLKTVKNKVIEMVRNNCIVQIEEEKATDISIMIQRTLGTKLMPYIANIGGAKAPMPNDANVENKVNKNKSSISQTGKSSVLIEKNNKIILIEYKINVKDKKIIEIKSVTPRIKTMDSSEIPIIDFSVLKFVSIETHFKDGTTSILSRAPFVINKSQTAYFRIECKKNCIFDIKIDWEEKDHE